MKAVNPENILLGGADEDTLIKNLIDWQKGFLSEKIEIRRGEYGVGVYAVENLEEDEELFTSNNDYLIKLNRAFEVVKVSKLIYCISNKQILFNKPKSKVTHVLGIER